jgi:hypothetical protein
MHRAGYFKKCSSSFYTPDSPSNPKPGVYYLRHVGFLGAAAPAVKGLRDATFAASEEGVVEFSMAAERTGASLWRRLRDWLIAKEGLESADKVIPTWDVSMLEEEAAREESPAATSFADGGKPGGTLMVAVGADDRLLRSTDNGETWMEDAMKIEEQKAELEKKAAELAKQTAENAAQAASFAEREKALAAKEAGARRAELAEFVEGLVKDGARVLPADKAGVTELLAAVPAASTIEFAEADGKKATKPMQEWLKGFLSRLPKQVDFAERAPGASAVDTADAPAIAAAAQRYQAEQAKAGVEIRISEAVRHVTAA